MGGQQPFDGDLAVSIAKSIFCRDNSGKKAWQTRPMSAAYNKQANIKVFVGSVIVYRIAAKIITRRIK